MKANANLKHLVNGIASMNMDVLNTHLKKEYSYQDTTKEIFLSELSKLFTNYKSEGDTGFTSYKGKCSGKGCSGCSKSGFQFVGNVTRNYFNLLFITDGDGTVTDIYECNEFITALKVENLESANWIYIHADDKVHFNKTPEYWIKLTAAMAAYHEIVHEPDPLDFYTIDKWLQKHAATAKSIESPAEAPGMKSRCFTNLYRQLTTLQNYINSNEPLLEKANAEYRLITDEKSLLDWLLEYEPLYNKSPYEFHDVAKQTENSYAANDLKKFVFTGTRYSTTFNFIACYRKHHTEMLNKYGTYTEEELIEVVGHEQYDYTANPAFSLKFHLERRDEEGKLGFGIPLNLN
ncbi:MAG: hypothetical protein KF763_19120 [Cyclobacteriaceae bacterium]|nr:hypothetical protein [Cyclobacteriaceae bacterium]